MTKDDWKKLYEQLYIRFNTSPKLYQKADFGLLLRLLKYIFDNEGGTPSSIEIETEGEGYFVTNLESNDNNIVTVTKDYLFSSEDDVLQIVPLLPEMITDMVNGTFDLECLEDFTGNINYIPMTSQEVHEMIENIFNNGTTDSLS